MGKIIGIDLGTTTSEIAYLYEGKPKIIGKTEGDRIIPSVVGLNIDNILVFGNEAKRQLALYPDKTVQEVKRLMGSNIKVKMGDKEYLPQEISALLLRYLKQCAEEYLGDKVTEAVITVPAMFNHLQRQATKDAAEIAGLKVERIINEPTAAALAYGLENLDKDEKVLVYDLGGGTFDVSILEMFEGILDVKVSRGNNALGGKDFDERLMNYIFNEFYRLHEIDLRKKGEHVLYRIKEAAEVAKIALSSNEYTDIILPYICQDRDWNPIDISISVTRQQFENMIWDMIQSTEHIVDEALKESGYKVDDINVVLAIGGSTRIPCVQRLLNRKFGGKVRTDISPDEAVALGAAIQAGIKSGQYDSATEILITDTCSYSLGTSVVSYVGAGQLMDGIYDVLIPKNTTIPYTCRKTYTTVHDYQTSVNIEVYQGEEALVKNNLKIGVFTLSGIPEDLAGKQNIEISFTYDKNGILQVDATVVSTGVRATHKYILESMDSKQIETSKADLETLWRNSAFAEKSKAIIEIAGSKLEHLKPDDRKKVEDVITKLKQAIADENENLIEKYDTELTDLMFELE